MSQAIPEMHLVDSSNVDSIGHDPDGQMLYVLFRHGTLYRYLGVPKEVFEDFLKAGSKGQFLHNRIKPFYNYERL